MVSNNNKTIWQKLSSNMGIRTEVPVDKWQKLHLHKATNKPDSWVKKSNLATSQLKLALLWSWSLFFPKLMGDAHWVSIWKKYY